MQPIVIIVRSFYVSPALLHNHIWKSWQRRQLRSNTSIKIKILFTSAVTRINNQPMRWFKTRSGHNSKEREGKKKHKYRKTIQWRKQHWQERISLSCNGGDGDCILFASKATSDPLTSLWHLKDISIKDLRRVRKFRATFKYLLIHLCHSV